MAVAVSAVAAAAPAVAGTRVKKPGPPANVTVLPVSGGASVSWDPPASDGGSTITGYTVEASPGKDQTCSTSGATTCTVTGLTNGRDYHIRVRATNSVGTGRASQAKSVIAGQSQDCSDFSPGADLQYCVLDRQDLNGVDLDGANLTGAKLIGTTLTGANLDGATVSGADATNSDLDGATLTDANLSGTFFIDAVLTNTDLDGATLTGDLSGVSSGGITGTPAALRTGWSLVDGYLVGPGADLASADLDGASLASADLDDATLTDANLSGANLTDADLADANLNGADLDGATLTGVVWSDTTCPDGTNSNNDGGTCANNLG